jgi:hypothetical protein
LCVLSPVFVKHNSILNFHKIVADLCKKLLTISVNIYAKKQTYFHYFCKNICKNTKCYISAKILDILVSFQPYISRVPADERAYLRDQRSKIGSCGNLQAGKVGPLTAARKPAAGTTRHKSNPKRSQPLEQVFVNPDMTYEVRNILIELENIYLNQIPTY